MKRTKKCAECSLLQEDDLKMHCPALEADLVYSTKVPIEEIDCPLWTPSMSKLGTTCSICNNPANVLQRLKNVPTFRCDKHLARNSTWIIFLNSKTDVMREFRRMKEGIGKETKEPKKKKKKIVLSEIEKKCLKLIRKHKEIVIASMPKKFRGTLGKLEGHGLIAFGEVDKRLDEFQVRKLKTVKVKDSLDNLFS